MSNSMSDDYFSFMSDRGRDKNPTRSGSLDVATSSLPKSVQPTDIIDFEQESQIQVEESIVSDTMIQRIFKQFAKEGAN